jgi:hypothetical protein
MISNINDQQQQQIPFVTEQQGVDQQQLKNPILAEMSNDH